MPALAQRRGERTLTLGVKHTQGCDNALVLFDTALSGAPHTRCDGSNVRVDRFRAGTRLREPARVASEEGARRGYRSYALLQREVSYFDRQYADRPPGSTTSLTGRGRPELVVWKLRRLD